MKKSPTSAFLAVTLLCNSRCVMCDIWKNKTKDLINVEVFKKLPKSLRMIDITGGEPFIRNDIGQVVRVIKDRCPKARLLITTNGLLPDKIKKQLPEILRYDPKIAFRVSLDGGRRTHDKMRQIPGAFDKATVSLKILRQESIRNLGVIFSMTKVNSSEAKMIYDYCKKERLKFSLNLVHDSSIYFGKKHMILRPEYKKVKEGLEYIVKQQKRSFIPQNWAKSWFNKQLLRYLRTHKRPLKCGAGESFFYMDPLGNIYACQFKSWLIGNLLTSNFETIWESQMRDKIVNKASKCDDCWMMCSARDEMIKNKQKVILEVICDKKI